MKVLKSILFLLFYLAINTNGYSQKYSLIISSKDSVENNILKNINFETNKLTKSQFKKNLEYISKEITKQGFLNAEIISKKMNDSVCYTDYKLNKQIDTVLLNYKTTDLLNEFINLEKLLTNKKQIAISFNEIKHFTKKIIQFYEKKGYPFIKIKLTNQKIRNTILQTDLIIQKKNSRKIDKVIVKGYDNFPEKYLKHNINNSKNKTFNKTKLTKIYTKINSISFITQIKKPEVLFLKDSTIIYVYLKKKKTSQFDGLIGFSSNKKSALTFSGHLNLKLNNIFDQGEEIEMIWNSTEDKNKNFNLNVDLPYIFNSKINPKTSFSLYKQDSSYVNITSSTTLNYIINNKNKIGFIASFEKSNTILKNEVNNISNYRTTLYGLEYTNETKSTTIFYENKKHLHLILKKGKKNDTNIDKTEIKIKMNYLFNLNKNITLNLNNYSAINISDNILENEFYNIGGTNNIRGFKDNSIFSSKYSIITTNLDYKLNKKTYFYTIIDYGYSYNKKNNTLYSFGIGYKSKLKSSILNINYALGKTNNKAFDTKQAIFNINFVSYF